MLHNAGMYIVRLADTRFFLVFFVVSITIMIPGCSNQERPTVSTDADVDRVLIPTAVLYIQAEDEIVIETHSITLGASSLFPSQLPVRTKLPDGQLVDGLYPPKESQLRTPGRPPPIWDIPTMIRFDNGAWIAVRVPGNLYSDGTITTAYQATAKVDSMLWEGHTQFRVLVNGAVFPRGLIQRRELIKKQRREP